MVHRFTRLLRNMTTAIYLDNVTATSYLNKEGGGGGNRSAPLNRLTLDILKFCQDHGFFLIPSYLLGVANLSADALSSCQESNEWFLNTQVVNKIFRKIGRAQVDLFASRESAHLPVYFSIYRKDRRAAGINALVQRWKFKKK